MTMLKLGTAEALGWFTMVLGRFEEPFEVTWTGQGYRLMCGRETIGNFSQSVEEMNGDAIVDYLVGKKFKLKPYLLADGARSPLVEFDRDEPEEPKCWLDGGACGGHCEHGYSGPVSGDLASVVAGAKAYLADRLKAGGAYDCPDERRAAYRVELAAYERERAATVRRVNLLNEVSVEAAMLTFGHSRHSPRRLGAEPYANPNWPEQVSNPGYED